MLTFSLTEGAFLLWVQEFVRNAVLDPLVCFYTKLGNHGMLWIALCLLMLLWPRTRRAGAAGALALVFSYLVTNVTLKHLVARTRPWLTLEGLIPLVVEPDPNSFPSGHTSAALAAAVAWRRALPRGWAAAGLTAAVCMGLTRLYAGVHYPSDVLCGALVGILCGELAWYLSQRWLDRKKGCP